MEFEQTIRRRHMVRRFDADRPVDARTVDDLLDLARRAPSAGHSQGWHFLVLTAETDRTAFWTAASEPDRVADRWLAGMSTAPILVLCWSERQAYEQRYGEPDKNRGPGTSLEDRWPVPYWHIDTGMAALVLLLGAVDRGLGACLFGVPPGRVQAVRSALAVPERFTPVGVVALGHPAPPGRNEPAGSARRGRRARQDVVSYGRFGRYPAPASSD